MTSDRPVPDLTGLDPASARRVELTVSCHDCDDLPKVEGAGSTVRRGDTEVQVMHNGVVVERGGYFGDWMAEIIRALRGHHEPQEERVFAAVLDRLAADGPPEPTAIELGAFWAYYSLWFLDRFPAGRVVAMEPDVDNLELGRRNFALNHRTGTFVHGVIGPEPGATTTFHSELTGRPFEVPQHDLGSLLALSGRDTVDLLLCDIQGAETFFFDQAADLLRQGRVRFAIVSTHHHTISGDALTHRSLLARLRELGAHVITEHTVGESYSGDGLIAVSFAAVDRDLVVETSRARQGDSLFGDLEVDLAAAQAGVTATQAQLHAREQELAGAREAQRAAERELAAVRGTRLWRYAERPRHLYSAVRTAAGRRLR